MTPKELWQRTKEPPTDLHLGDPIAVNLNDSGYSFEILIDRSEAVAKMCADAGLSPTEKGYGTWRKYEIKVKLVKR